MGANQSGHELDTSSHLASHNITVVHPNPEQGSSSSQFTLPLRVPPILNIDGHVVDSQRHKPEFQINSNLILEVVDTIDRFTNSRADLVSSRQNHLQDKITHVDRRVQQFTDSYINDKHRALARLNENHRKIEDMNKLFQKCTIQSKICVDMLNKLNFLLPDEKKLEPLELE